LVVFGAAAPGARPRLAAQEMYWPSHGWRHSTPEAPGVVFTGGGFEPGDIGSFIGRAIKSDRPLPEDTAGAARLAAAVHDASRPPSSRSPSRFREGRR